MDAAANGTQDKSWHGRLLGAFAPLCFQFQLSVRTDCPCC